MFCNFSSQRSGVPRASDDYYPRNQKTQIVHIAAVAFNSVLLGEVMVPDWDMVYVSPSSCSFIIGITQQEFHSYPQ